MAFFTKDQVKEFKKLIEKSDWAALAGESRAAGIKDGQGYSGTHFKNFILHGYSCADPVYNFIIDYFKRKKEKIIELESRNI